MIDVEIINGKECITVAEFAAKMGFSLSTAYRRLRDSQMTKYIVTNENGDNRKFLDKSVLLDVQPLSHDNHIVTNDNHIVTDDNGQNTDLNALIGIFRDQLAAKDAEIDRLHTEIADLHRLIDQQQRLQAAQQIEEPRRWRRKQRG